MFSNRLCSKIVIHGKPGPVARRLALAVVFLAVVQTLAGAINVLLLAPVWMQLTHLFIADLFGLRWS